MIANYRERYVQEMYDELNIYEPIDIDESRICDYFGINLRYHQGQSFYAGNIISINKNIHPKEQRAHFFHELAHIIRQDTGNQIFTPQIMTDWLERDADIFAMYACLPWHMVRRYDLTDYDLPCYLSDDFMVPHDMVYKRLYQIKERLTL